MRYTDLFGKTRRDAPAEISDPARRLAWRAGLLRLQGGQDVFLPLASRVLARLQATLRDSLQEWGAQELRGLASIEASTLAAQELQSYKQLPARVFWTSGGLTRVHALALEANGALVAQFTDTLSKLGERLWALLDLTPREAQDVGSARVWYVPWPSGALEVLRCTSGPYAGTRASAKPLKTRPGADEALLPLEPVETPHCPTIESLAQFLDVPTSRTAKAVFYVSNGQLIFAVIRGDLMIDEDKLKRALPVSNLRPATDEDITRVGAVPGYASPVGVRGATIIVDESVVEARNLVAGANREGYHLLNTNVPRDYKPDLITDIAYARAGDPCPEGDGTLEAVQAIELGRVRGPDELSATYLDPSGRAQKVYAVQLELDLAGALLAYIAFHSDDKGILWSRALAPFDIHLVALNADKPEVAAELAQVSGQLDASGLSYLVDDRNESAGVKFNDADLIGLPLRLTLGPKTVAQKAVELKERTATAARLVTLDALANELASLQEV